MRSGSVVPRLFFRVSARGPCPRFPEEGLRMRPDPADWTLGVIVHLVYGEKGRSRGRLEYSPIIAIAARVADRRPDRAPNAKFGRNLRISLENRRSEGACILTNWFWGVSIVRRIHVNLRTRQIWTGRTLDSTTTESPPQLQRLHTPCLSFKTWTFKSLTGIQSDPQRTLSLSHTFNILRGRLRRMRANHHRTS